MNFTWIAVGDERTCLDCAGRSGASLPLDEWESIGLPGDGATICADYCRCVVMADGLIEAIALSEGLSPDLTIDEIIDIWGLGMGIRVIPGAVQSSLIGAGLGELADLDYEDAREALLSILSTTADYDISYEVMSLRELTEIYRGG